MTQGSPGHERRSWTDVLGFALVAVIVFVGTVIRLWLSQRGYHNDEIGMFDPSGVSSILFNTELASNPPLLQVLFAVFPNAWVLPAGRFVSTLVGSAGVGVSAWVAWRHGGAWAAVLTALALAFSVPHLTDTTMFRAYAWLCFLVPLFAELTSEVLTLAGPPSRRQVVGLAVLGGLLSWIHYLTLPFVLLVFLLTALRHQARSVWVPLAVVVLSWAPFFRWYYLWGSARSDTEGLTGTTRILSLDVATNDESVFPITLILIATVSAIALTWRRAPRTRVLLIGALMAQLFFAGLSTFMLVRSPIISPVLALWAPPMAAVVTSGIVVTWMMRLVMLYVISGGLRNPWDPVHDGGVWLGTNRDLNATKAMVARIDELAATAHGECVYVEDMMIADLLRYYTDALLTDMVPTCGGCASFRCAIVHETPFVWVDGQPPAESLRLWDRRFDRPRPDAAHGCTELIVDPSFVLARCPPGTPTPDPR